MNTRRALLTLVLAPAAWLVACGGNDGIDDRLGVADPKVRLVHAVPAAPAVSLFRDDAAQPENANVTAVPYKGASNYFDVSANTHKWEVKTATTPAVSLGSVQFEHHRGNKYTLVAVPDAGSLTTVVTIDDPFEKGLTSDNARVRAFNAAFNSAPIDVYLTAPAVSIASVNPQFVNVGFKQAAPNSGTNSMEVEGGAYVLRVTATGTKAVLFSAAVTLDKNADWLLVPVPASVTPNDMRVLVVRSDGGPATELINQP
ncbi:MAG TPA: DUF4397 domain-containing protein [Burkholderiaceae bacterium]|nr:DUF4397 domain-containing protein [Burkholderiaceae bacterium]